MREHQIVITLKPEQFLEVQRLARAAHAKSMGIYVRQQLLAALGIDGAAPAAAAASSASVQNLQPVATELRRLHGELKMFVAESLSLYSGEITPTDNLEGIGGESVSAALSNALPPVLTLENAGDVLAATNKTDNTALSAIEPAGNARSVFIQAEDELEQAAQKAFSISPRLGAIGEVGARPPLQPTGQQQSERVREMIARHDHRHDGHHLHHPVPNQQLDEPFIDPSEPVDPLQRLLAADTPRKQPAPLQPPAVQTAASESYGRFDAAAEESEPLAEASEDDEQVTPSLAERHRQLLERDQLNEDFVEETDETGATGTGPVPPVPPPQDPNIKPSTGAALGIPPFSGSPPPKRRQV